MGNGVNDPPRDEDRLSCSRLKNNPVLVSLKQADNGYENGSSHLFESSGSFSLFPFDEPSGNENFAQAFATPSVGNHDAVDFSPSN